jgi:hypothetical protein
MVYNKLQNFMDVFLILVDFMHQSSTDHSCTVWVQSIQKILKRLLHIFPDILGLYVMSSSGLISPKNIDIVCLTPILHLLKNYVDIKQTYFLFQYFMKCYFMLVVLRPSGSSL